MKLEIKKIGNSTGIILPKELLVRLGLAQGDELFVTELPDRAVKLSVYNPHHEKVMEIGREVFKEYRLLSPENLESYRREAAKLETLDHPGIVKLYCVGDAPGLESEQ